MVANGRRLGRMKISRSLFLALTGAMAGTACQVETVPPPAPPPPPQAAYPYSSYYTYRTYAPGRPAPPTPPPPAAEGTAPPYAYTYPNQPVRQLSPRIPIRNRNLRPVGLVTADPGYRAPPPGFFTLPGP